MTRYTIVSTRDRPDLAPVTARWRWDAFFRASGGRSLEDVVAGAERTAATSNLFPQTLVLLADEEPIGTASLTEHDLDERPELSPWLAGLVVVPHARRQGHAAKLVRAIENTAVQAAVPTLWLYTNTAERIYARLGWVTWETIQQGGKPFAIMRRALTESR